MSDQRMRGALTETAHGDADRVINSGLRTLDLEMAGLAALADALRGSLRQPFLQAVHTIKSASTPASAGHAGGRVVVAGMGKSGHVGRKIAATLASTGTPALFVHPAEAMHGDLGMITRNDVILALSWSGETAELRSLTDYSRRFGIALISMTANAASTLAKASDISLVLPDAREACPHNLAPTTSSVMQLALGDALAIALLDSRGFSALDFRELHPGGRLGAMLTFVRDLMHTGDRIPLAAPGVPMREAIATMSAKGFGCVGIVDATGALAGIITDGDLRRHLSADLLDANVESVMTRTPVTTQPDQIASQALAVMDTRKITALFVVEDGKPIGILHMHDLLRAGVS
jgi:arabinose-5-phosphate isomerase